MKPYSFRQLEVHSFRECQGGHLAPKLEDACFPWSQLHAPGDAEFPIRRGFMEIFFGLLYGCAWFLSVFRAVGF